MTADDVDALEAFFAAIEVADRPFLWSDASSESAAARAWTGGEDDRLGFCVTNSEDEIVALAGLLILLAR